MLKKIQSGNPSKIKKNISNVTSCLHPAVPRLHLAELRLYLAVPMLHLAVPRLHPVVLMLHSAVLWLHLALGSMLVHFVNLGTTNERPGHVTISDIRYKMDQFKRNYPNNPCPVVDKGQSSCLKSFLPILFP